MPYWRLYYHIIWATYRRLPLVDAEAEELIAGTLHAKARELGCYIHVLGMMEEHLHLVATIPPALAIADVVGGMKGSSSHAANHLARPDPHVFKWQEGYGVLSFGERSLPTVAAYVRNQKERHAERTTNPLLERIDPALPRRPSR